MRLYAIDWLRGLVMVLMTVDHASDVFNRNIVSQDSAAWGAVGASLTIDDGNPLHFLTRWITHLCAPTFVFLAGTSLALSINKRTARGESASAIDRHLLARGLVLILFELWMSIGFTMPILQVLYAIGASIVCMVVLRRLSSALLLVLALGWIGLGELAVERMGLVAQLSPPWWAGLLFVNGIWQLSQSTDLGIVELSPMAMVPYPLLGWLPVLMLGWTFGRFLVARAERGDVERAATRLLLVAGGIGLVAFAAQRALNGYGNYWLPRTDDSLLRWLQVSKYPPSLAFLGLELGLMALILAALFRLQRARARVASPNAPLLVFGQAALFYYLIHLHLMGMFCILVFGGGFMQQPCGLAGAWIGALCATVVLYPLCRWFRSVKHRRPAGWLRFV